MNFGIVGTPAGVVAGPTSAVAGAGKAAHGPHKTKIRDVATVSHQGALHLMQELDKLLVRDLGQAGKSQNFGEGRRLGRAGNNTPGIGSPHEPELLQDSITGFAEALGLRVSAISLNNCARQRALLVVYRRDEHPAQPLEVLVRNKFLRP